MLRVVNSGWVEVASGGTSKVESAVLVSDQRG